jgi:hypothetical protein
MKEVQNHRFALTMKLLDEKLSSMQVFALTTEEQKALEDLKKKLSLPEFSLENCLELEKKEEEASCLHTLDEAQKKDLKASHEIFMKDVTNHKVALGCKDLYIRIATGLSEENPDISLYKKEMKMVLHLLRHCKDVPEDQNVILAAFTNMVGRCYGSIADIEALYSQYCIPNAQPTSGVDAIIEKRAFLTRLGLQNRYILEHGDYNKGNLHDVHRRNRFCNAVATHTALPTSAEEGDIAEDEETLATGFISLFDACYGELFLEEILAALKKPLSEDKVFLKESELEKMFTLLTPSKDAASQGEKEPEEEQVLTFEEVLFLDMVRESIFEDLAHILKEQAKAFPIKEMATYLGCSSEQEFLENYEEMYRDIQTDPYGCIQGEKGGLARTIVFKYLLVPTCQKLVTKEMVYSYLQKRGFLIKE